MSNLYLLELDVNKNKHAEVGHTSPKTNKDNFQLKNTVLLFLFRQYFASNEASLS